MRKTTVYQKVLPNFPKTWKSGGQEEKVLASILVKVPVFNQLTLMEGRSSISVGVPTSQSVSGYWRYSRFKDGRLQLCPAPELVNVNEPHY